MLVTSDEVLTAYIRELLKSIGSRYAAVAYVKKDGSIRRQTVQAGNDEAYTVDTEQSRKYAETMAIKHPDMVRMRDIRELIRLRAMPDYVPEDDKKCWRTITASRLMTVRMNGKFYRLRTYEQALAGMLAYQPKEDTRRKVKTK